MDTQCCAFQFAQPDANASLAFTFFFQRIGLRSTTTNWKCRAPQTVDHFTYPCRPPWAGRHISQCFPHSKSDTESSVLLRGLHELNPEIFLWEPLGGSASFLEGSLSSASTY